MRNRALSIVIIAAILAVGCGTEEAKVKATNPSPTPNTAEKVKALTSASPTPLPKTLVVKKNKLPKAESSLVDAVLYSKSAVCAGAAVQAYSGSVGELFERERWSELETLISEIRRERSEVGGPIRTITAYYSVLKGPRGFPGNSEFIPHLLRCRSWLKARPNSTAARIVTARSLLTFAQQNYRFDPELAPSSVRAWTQKPLGYAGKYLKEVEAKGLAQDPEVYATWVDLERLRRGSEKSVQRWVSKAEKIDPSYFAPSGQYAKYLAQLGEKSDSWWRAVPKTEFLPMVVQTYLTREKARLPFERMREALSQMESKYPQSSYIKNMYCKLSLRMRDRDVARRLFKEIGEQYEPFIWSLEEFHNERNRIMGAEWTPSKQVALKLPSLPEIGRHPLSQRSTLIWQIVYLWRWERFAELDEVAKVFMKKKSKLEDGTSKLDILIVTLSHASDEAAKKRNFVLCKRWFKRHPESPLARTLLLDHYVNKAWESRGSGWAYQVSKTGWAGFNKNIGEAVDIISESIASTKRYPAAFYGKAITVAMGAGVDQEIAEALFDRATEIDPLDSHSYRAMSVFLLPRWHGEPGDWDKFAQRQVQKHGDFAYFLMYHAVYTYGKESGVGLSKKQARAGAIDYATRVGAPTVWNNIAGFAVETKDKELAKAAFAKIGENWEPGVFPTRSFFLRCKKWAIKGAPYPSF